MLKNGEKIVEKYVKGFGGFQKDPVLVLSVIQNFCLPVSPGVTIPSCILTSTLLSHLCLCQESLY